MLELGIKAPDFELPDQDGVMHKLSDYAGKKVNSNSFFHNNHKKGELLYSIILQ